MDDIVILLPGEPWDVSRKVIPRVIQWLAEPPHSMEAVWTPRVRIESENKVLFIRMTDANRGDGELCNFLEMMKPPDWDEDRVRMFMGLVGHFVMKEAQKEM